MNANVVRFVWLIAALLTFAAGCSNEDDLPGFAAIANDIQAADSLAIYEGLPHPGWEPEWFAEEKHRDDAVQLDGGWFYGELLQPLANDEQTLTALVASPAHLAVLEGEKTCGGFHADWCFEWGAGETATRAHVCFTCQEVKFWDATGQPRRYDLDLESARKLKSQLQKYRKNRSGSELYESSLPA